MVNIVVGQSVKTYCGRLFSIHMKKPVTWSLSKFNCRDCDRHFRDNMIQVKPAPKEAYSSNEDDYGFQKLPSLHAIKASNPHLPIKYATSDITIGEVVLSKDSKLKLKQ